MVRKKIKIVYIINSLNIGGSEKVLIESANGLDSNKYEAVIISLTLFNENKSMLNVIKLNSNIKVFYFDYLFFDNYSLRGYLKLFKKSKNEFRDVDKIVKVIKEEEPDIIHFHTTPRELIIKKFFNVKASYIFTDHLLRINRTEYGIIKSKLLALIYKRLYEGFSVIAVSGEIENSLERNRVLSEKQRISTILNGVNVSEFRNDNSKKKSNEFVVVYVSRIETIKGHEDLIKAWAQLKDIEKRHLYIVGPDGLNNKIQNLAKQLNCLDTITFTGSVSNPKEFLSIANVAVFPSYKEGLPLALLEKMAMGLPVIVSDIDELTSVITDNKNGLIFKLGNYLELSEKIRFLYLNPSKAKFIGDNARKTVEAQYDLADNHKKIEAFYDQVLNRNEINYPI